MRHSESGCSFYYIPRIVARVVLARNANGGCSPCFDRKIQEKKAMASSMKFQTAFPVSFSPQVPTRNLNRSNPRIVSIIT
jgi:hypothetical protein